MTGAGMDETPTVDGAVAAAVSELRRQHDTSPGLSACGASESDPRHFTVSGQVDLVALVKAVTDAVRERGQAAPAGLVTLRVSDERPRPMDKRYD